MKLILIRHAEAVDLGAEDAQTDFDRYLTSHGRATAAKLADTLKSREIHLDAILSSPLIRAVQTAEPLLELSTVRQILICEALTAGKGKPKKVAERLNGMTGKTVALVGHRPDLDELLAWLIGAPSSGVKMAKGAAARLSTHGEVREGGCTLNWMIMPEFYFPAVVAEKVPLIDAAPTVP